MIHFTADLHLGHKKIIGMTGRPFRSIEEHDEALITLINTHVATDDTLFVLGDFCWGDARPYLASIVCENVCLIIGNHDTSNSYGAFECARDTFDLKIQGRHVFLSHYPHAFWPSSHYGSLHLYGHCHAEREETLDAAFPERRSMDVGVDNARLLRGEYRPFTEDEIVERLLTQKGHDPVEWYKEREKNREV